MKKLTTLTVFVLFLCVELSAQFTFDWMQSAGNNSKVSVMSSVDSDDNLIVTGYWQNNEIFTRKYDINGTLLWEVSDASGMSGIYEKSNWINTDADNNILVVGNMYSYSGSTGWDYPTDIVALKYNPNGDLLWKTIIPISITITSLNRFNTRSELDSEGNLYIGTTINAPDGTVLYKIDQNGNLLFSTPSIENLPRNFSSMRVKGNRVVLASGSTSFNVAPVYVYDTSGTLLWTAAADGLIASDVEIDENNNIYILSSVEDAVSANSGYDMRITKYDETGNFLWIQNYDFEEGAEIARKLTLVNNRLSAIGYGTSSPASPYFDWKTLQTDMEGNLLWFSIYDATTFNDEEPYYVLAKPTGGVVVTGKGGPSPDPNNPSFIQMPIVEYDGNGNQIWIDTPNQYGGWGLACMFASDWSMYVISSSDMTVYHYFGLPLGISEIDLNEPSATIYPNPVSENATVEIKLKEPALIEISVYDISGNAVLNLPKQLFSSGLSTSSLNLNGLSSGMYLAQIKSDSFTKILKIIKI